MRGPLDIHRRLLAGGVAHEIHRLPRRVASAQELPESLGVPAASCAVVHVVVADGTPVAVVLPAGRTWSPAATARAVGARAVRRADPGEASAATEYSHALISPLALPNGLRVFVDRSLLRADIVYAATGQTATAVKIRVADLITATGAELAVLSGRGVTPVEPIRANDRFATAGT